MYLYLSNKEQRKNYIKKLSEVESRLVLAMRICLYAIRIMRIFKRISLLKNRIMYAVYADIRICEKTLYAVNLVYIRSKYTLRIGKIYNFPKIHCTDAKDTNRKEMYDGEQVSGWLDRHLPQDHHSHHSDCTSHHTIVTLTITSAIQHPAQY